MARLLVIDDDQGVRQTFVFMAILDGWEAFACDQFANVPHMISENQIDVLLMDYHMPPVTGLDMLQHIRSKGFQCPAIVVSGLALEIDPIRAETLGVQKILLKPPNVSELRTALTNALR